MMMVDIAPALPLGDWEYGLFAD